MNSFRKYLIEMISAKYGSDSEVVKYFIQMCNDPSCDNQVLAHTARMLTTDK